MNNKSRRNILRGLAVSLPATWAKPVVNSIVLPVHASTSDVAFCIQVDPGENGYVNFNGSNWIPVNSPIYGSDACFSELGTMGCAGGLAYAPGGRSDANAICQSNSGVDALGELLNNVFACGCGEEP